MTTDPAAAPRPCAARPLSSIWNEPLADFPGGRQDRAATQDQIAERCGHFIATYAAASSA